VNAWLIGLFVFVCVFGGALAGMYLRSALPAANFSDESKDAVKLGMGLVATMAALVLGLLVASAKSTYDEQKTGFDQISANLILLDGVLAQYGPEALPARRLLHDLVARGIGRIWPDDASQTPTLEPASATEGMSYHDLVLGLVPANDRQRTLRDTAEHLSIDMGRARWLLVAQVQSDPIPVPFLTILVFWLIALFASFGLFAPANRTVVSTLLLSALSVAGAIFLIIELSQPFEGLVRISSTPMQAALSRLAQ
jgi:hypothetical protein